MMQMSVKTDYNTVITLIRTKKITPLADDLEADLFLIQITHDLIKRQKRIRVDNN